VGTEFSGLLRDIDDIDVTVVVHGRNLSGERELGAWDWTVRPIRVGFLWACVALCKREGGLNATQGRAD
jgi:hypothetical protein